MGLFGNPILQAFSAQSNACTLSDLRKHLETETIGVLILGKQHMLSHPYGQHVAAVQHEMKMNPQNGETAVSYLYYSVSCQGPLSCASLSCGSCTSSAKL